MDDQTGSDVTRRDFLKATAAATVAAAAGSLLASAPRSSAAPLAPARVLGANDRIQVGIVGVKGMGAGHIKHILEEMPGEAVEITAVCDVWEKARRMAAEATRLPEAQAFSDYRRMLDFKDLDAVVVATPDHTHAPIAIAALRAGKHVYVEKPLTRHLDEAFRLLDAVRRSGKVVQLGTQGCTEPQWHKAREIVKTGVLGKVLWAQASYCRNNPLGEWNYEIDPEAEERTVDWRAWLGPARKRPWSAERYFRWRKYWDYGTGVIGDLLPHRLAPLYFALGLNEYPSAVSCLGGNLVDSDRGPGAGGKPYGERREVADTQLVTVQFPSGLMLFLASATVNERGVDDVIRGHRANLSLGGGRVVLEPERPYSDDLEREDHTPELVEHNHANHVRNWLQAIHGNEPLNSPIEMAVEVQTIVCMAEKAYRQRKLVRFDPSSRKMRT